MIHRVYPFFVVALWLGSMSWLVVQKILPPLLGGTPPDYQSELNRPDPDYWRISWNDRAIGYAASQVHRHAKGVREIRNVVRFEDVPVESLVSEALGVWTKLVKPLLGTTADLRANAVVGTQVWFDALGQLAGFHTVLDLEGSPALFTVQGQVAASGELEVVARCGEPSAVSTPSADPPLFRQTIRLPPEALISDAFTPRGELANLQVGQAWTMPIYRPFPPNSPVEIVAVKAERHDVIIWDGQDVETVMLVYRSDAGSGLSVSRDPIATEWIRADGTVLRQEVVLSGVHLRFERLPPSTLDPGRLMLDPAKYPRLWSGSEAAGAAAR
jgi:hypothetical protein